MNIEAEVRSFITKEKHDELVKFFRENAKLVLDDYQESFYFSGEQDLRIQRNNFYAKVWLKKGSLHDDHREELEVRFDRKDFETAEKIFLSLGFKVGIKWFRKRLEFRWDDITVCLDHTKGYGYIIELEKMSSESDKEKNFEELKAKLESLGVKITSRKEFEEKFQHYKKNWKKLV